MNTRSEFELSGDVGVSPAVARLLTNIEQAVGGAPGICPVRAYLVIGDADSAPLGVVFQRDAETAEFWPAPHGAWPQVTA